MSVEKITHCPESEFEFNSWIAEFQQTKEHDSSLSGPFFENEQIANVYDKAPEMKEVLKMVALCSNYEEAKKISGDSPKHWTRRFESLLKELE